ncbi:MAG: DMT family transporter [Deltaproteobacteria bacterium]|nr:DMT family transporter [Deltaproteobacteria bacterium]
MSQARDNLTGIGLMIAAATSFAAFSALVKVVHPRIPVFEIIFFRGAITWALLGLWRRSRPAAIPAGASRRDLLTRALLGFAGLVMYVWAVTHVELGIASALNQSSPVFVGLFAFLLLGEKPHRLVPPLVLLGFAGAVLIVSPDLGGINIHAAVGFASALASALAYTWVRKLAATEHPVTIVQWFSGLVMVLGFPLMLLEGWVTPTPFEALMIFLQGLLSLAGQLFLTWAYTKGEAAVVSPFIFAAVLETLVAGWLFWDEWPPQGAIVGASLLVLSSLGIVVLARRDRPVVSEPPVPADPYPPASGRGP